MTNGPVLHDDGRGALVGLRVHEPSLEGGDRVRERCREALVEARRHEAVHGEPGWRFALGVALAPTVIGVLCAVYLFQVIGRALQLYRF
jgi:hypothetical protein